jgi:(heptosyl)LPS beta-1,4-glucosyltransferase
MLSVVICAFNEEANLPRAISSAKAIADEIIVVDTESTDKTAAIAKKAGCTVYTHKYPGIVEPIRNFAIGKAKGDWIFLLDADEEISQPLATAIKAKITSADADYYRIPRKNIIFGKWIKSDHWWPDYVYRLFKKGSVTWDPKIHSIPYTKGKGGDFPVDENLALIHHNYGSISQFVLRLDRYTDFQSREIMDAGYNFAQADILVKPLQEFTRQYFARRGYSDGFHGLALALLQAFSTLVVYLKLWEQGGSIDQQIELKNLPAAFSPPLAENRWWYYDSLAKTTGFPQNLWWKLRKKLSSV